MLVIAQEGGQEPGGRGSPKFIEVSKAPAPWPPPLPPGRGRGPSTTNSFEKLFLARNFLVNFFLENFFSLRNFSEIKIIFGCMGNFSHFTLTQSKRRFDQSKSAEMSICAEERYEAIYKAMSLIAAKVSLMLKWLSQKSKSLSSNSLWLY